MSEPFAKPEELNYSLALRAHQGTSFVPERRAHQRQMEYADAVNEFYDKLKPLVVEPAQRAIFDDEMARYKAGYLAHFGAYLSASSRVVSSMIAGPSNFPAARMEKRGNTAHRRLQEFLDWDKRAKESIVRRLKEARSPEAKAESDWQLLKRDIAGSLETIEAIDERGSFYTRSAFVNSIVGKVERLAKNGRADLVAKAIEFVKEYNAAHKKPAIAARNGFWKLADAAVEVAAAPVGDVETIAKGEGVEIVVNPPADRVQIVFEAKPPRDVIERLKADCWRWAPSEGAWQRKLTPAARASAMKFASVG